MNPSAMRIPERALLPGILLALLLAACATAPVTGRRQLVLIPPQESAALGVEAFEQIKGRTPVVDGTGQARTVERVGRSIAAVVPDAQGMAWEFRLFEDDSPNAFALPGGKVGVNTGLFRVAGTEAQLAAVMGHEIAHVMAQHSAERMSRDIVTQLGLGVLGAATRSQAAVDMVASGAQLGIGLPFNRDQESEADIIGLEYMARAGHDPRAAVDLWRNFAAAGGERPPQFLSTHPAPENRIARLEAHMPQALELWRASGARH